MLYEELYDGFDDCSSEDNTSDDLDTDGYQMIHLLIMKLMKQMIVIMIY